MFYNIIPMSLRSKTYCIPDFHDNLLCQNVCTILHGSLPWKVTLSRLCGSVVDEGDGSRRWNAKLQACRSSAWDSWALEQHDIQFGTGACAPGAKYRS